MTNFPVGRLNRQSVTREQALEILRPLVMGYAAVETMEAATKAALIIATYAQLFEVSVQQARNELGHTAVAQLRGKKYYRSGKKPNA